MRRLRRSFGRALLSGAVTAAIGAGTLGAPAGAATTQSGTPPPEAFIVVEAGTGAVISGRNMHEALPPASTAKIMTALVAVERLPPTALISVSPNAAARESMRIGMQVGARWPLNQAMGSLMMVSANDAAYAIAETVGGSIPGFAADLNATARRYGMHDSTLGDPAGLTDATSYLGGPKMSAFDLAIAARNALTVHEIAKYAGSRTYQFTDVSGVQHSLTNHDKFLPDNGFGYPGANGFKTGYTQAANHTLVATALRNGRQCIAVILGSGDSGYTWAASLLDQCFATTKIPAAATRLPPVAVSPYDTRAHEQQSFGQIVPGKGTHLAATTRTPATRTPKKSARATGAAGAAGTTTTHSGSGPVSTTSVLIVVFLLLVALVTLRRRAVKRQHARRVEHRRARAKAMRSGSLPVVDGRYRTGTRLGPPVESHVSVERARGERAEDDVDIDLTTDDHRRASIRRRSGGPDS